MDLLKNRTAEAGKGYAYTITYQGRDGSLRTDRWRYTRWGEDIQNENEELYDHFNDPEEHFNLAGDPDRRAVLEELREKYEAVRYRARNGLEICRWGSKIVE